MAKYERFLENNHAYFLEKLETIEDICVRIHGAGAIHAMDLFKKVIYEKDEYYFGFSLYMLFCGYLVEQDEDFVMNAFEQLSGCFEKPEHNHIFDYFHAFCLNQNEEYDESVDILNELAKKNFPPALVTLGDLQLVYKNKSRALEYYEIAIKNGHVTNLGWNLGVMNFDKGVVGVIFIFLGKLKNLVRHIIVWPKLVRTGHVGINLIRLNFYSLDRNYLDNLR